MTLSSQLLPGVPLIESPLFAQSIDDMGLTPQERSIALHLYEHGYAVLDFPDAEIDARIDRVKTSLSPRFGVDFSRADSIKNAGDLRIQDAWQFNEDIKSIAANPVIIALLSKLYGRRAFPFQTLNFPVGTQQAIHSDSVHFSSIPERFMCGVWVAMEDVHHDAGPLTYWPSSHRWPIVSNTLIGRRGFGSDLQSAQDPFGDLWHSLVQANGTEEELFLARKGQALIWCANLLHGGSRQIDGRLTRWSQVTHYYFDDCVYYTPAFSDEPLGQLALRNIIDIADGQLKTNSYLGKKIESSGDDHCRSGSRLAKWRKYLRKRLSRK